MRRRLQLLYVWLGQSVGRLSIVARNKYLRYAFMRVMGAMQRFFGIPPVVKWVTLRSGTMIRCDLRDNLQAELFYLRDYGTAELSSLMSRVKEGDVFVDVGAHCGLFSIEVAKKVGPEGKVYAFEPARDMAQQIRLNANANGVGQIVEVFEVALGDQSSEATLFAAPDGPGDAGRRSLFQQGEAIARVPVVRFDELVESGGLTEGDRLDAVKVDVEGAETLALRGMKESLRRLRPRVVVVEVLQSTLQRAGSSPEDLTALMSEIGYVPDDSVKELSHFNTAFVLREGVGGDGNRHRARD